MHKQSRAKLTLHCYLVPSFVPSGCCSLFSIFLFMRNIVVLDWGPASLFHLIPREKVKVRTAWLEGGPVLPPFLGEGKETNEDIIVRYAFSAFNGLNIAIKNLRNCFGFPYREYIGYLNTMTRQFRARREHEVLIDRLRRWAMFHNVDAVLWIDYAKSNQPSGSFKLGTKHSRPFSPHHVEVCSDAPGHTGKMDNDGDESEGMWSDADDDHPVTSQEKAVTRPRPDSGTRDEFMNSGVLKNFNSVKLTRKSRHEKHMLQAICTRYTAEAAAEAEEPVQQETSKRPAHPRIATPRQDTKEKQKAEVRTMLQEEVVPGYGSIYYRSVAPGPGYYGIPPLPNRTELAASFGKKVKTFIDRAPQTPGPGQYSPRAPVVPVTKFSVPVRLEVSPRDAAKKLPFISLAASDSFGLSGGSYEFAKMEAELVTPGFAKSPEYSFSRAPRPF